MSQRYGLLWIVWLMGLQRKSWWNTVLQNQTERRCPSPELSTRREEKEKWYERQRTPTRLRAKLKDQGTRNYSARTQDGLRVSWYHQRFNGRTLYSSGPSGSTDDQMRFRCGTWWGSYPPPSQVQSSTREETKPLSQGLHCLAQPSQPWPQTPSAGHLRSSPWPQTSSAGQLRSPWPQTPSAGHLRSSPWPQTPSAGHLRSPWPQTSSAGHLRSPWPQTTSTSAAELRCPSFCFFRAGRHQRDAAHPVNTSPIELHPTMKPGGASLTFSEAERAVIRGRG